MDMRGMRETWGNFTVPFKAEMKPESNGYVDVLDGDGNEICTCYGGNPAHNASGIAAALNLIFGKDDEQPDTTDEPPGGEADDEAEFI